MNCCVCGEGEPDYEAGSRACRRCGGRLAGALRQVPVLVDELRGLGYVERDVRPLACTTSGCDRPARWSGTFQARGKPPRPCVPYCGRCATNLLSAGLLFGLHPARSHADPVATALTAGPVNGASTGPRAAGTRERSLPIRVDPTDLLARPRHGSLQVAARSPWPDDQIGHLPAAAILDFWVRDWANIRGEGLPVPEVGRLCGWLSDRLDWALREHPALDEFAGDVSRLLGALYGLAGLGLAAPKLMEAPCPSCGLLALTQPFPEAYIECVCGRCLTPAEYEEYVMDMRHEIRALDVVAALNGGIHLDVTKLRFAVVTAKQDDDSAFGWGEVLVLHRDGREAFGRERRPRPSEIEVFDDLDGVMIRQGRLLREEAS